jgi:hypothetical protein
MEVALTPRRKQVLDILPNYKSNHSTILKLMNINCLSVSKQGCLPDALMELIKSYCFYEPKKYISTSLINIFRKSRSRYTMSLLKKQNRFNYESVQEWCFLAYKAKRALQAINCKICGEYSSIRICASRLFYNEDDEEYYSSYNKYDQVHPLGWISGRCICNCDEYNNNY